MKLSDKKRHGHVIARERLPENFPTHGLDAEFCEHLGRSVAAFGFLEEVLGKAIFALTATRQYPKEEIQEQLDKWLATLKKALSDPLQNLIEKYLKELRNHQNCKIENILEFKEDLNQLPPIRNAFCHGSWRTMDENGFAKPYYCDKRGNFWDTPVDVSYLKQVELATTGLAIQVIDTIIVMGFSFPGNSKFGEPIMQLPERD